MICLFSCFVTSCFETKSVVEIKKDGTAIYRVSNYSGLDQRIGRIGALLGANLQQNESKIFKAPTERELDKLASKIGEGVQSLGVIRGVNGRGWEGYEASFFIRNINGREFLLIFLALLQS